jgi:hypothetical protein
MKMTLTPHSVPTAPGQGNPPPIGPAQNTAGTTIVLSGGGAKGDFEVGAVRCLYNRGIRMIKFDPLERLIWEKSSFSLGQQQSGIALRLAMVALEDVSIRGRL